MKILCKSATQVPGFGIVSKGEHIEWPDGRPFPPQVLGNFVEVGTDATLCNKEPQPPTPPPANETGKDKGEQSSEGEPPKPGEGEPPKPGEGDETRPPTPEEAAAEQARAEQVAKDELVKRTAALGKEKLTAALDACGAAYKAKDSCETLAKILLRAQGQDID